MSEPTEMMNEKDMRSLIKRINKDDPKPEDLEALSKEMDKMPEIFSSFGNLQRTVFSEILREFAGSNFGKECTERYVEQMKTELGYKDSTFVEKMLIDEITMRWLRLQNTELYHKRATSESHTFDRGMYAEKRLEMAHRRFLRSMETLAKVRKMIAQTQAKGAEMFKSLLKKDN